MNKQREEILENKRIFFLSSASLIRYSYKLLTFVLEI